MSPSPTDWATSDRFCLSDDIRSIPRGSFRDLRQPHIRLTHQCGIGVIPVHAFQRKLGIDISACGGYTVSDGRCVRVSGLLRHFQAVLYTAALTGSGFCVLRRFRVASLHSRQICAVHSFHGKLGVDISVRSGYTAIVKRTTSTALLLDGRYGAFLFSTSEYAFSENLALTFPSEVDILLVEAFPR